MAKKAKKARRSRRAVVAQPQATTSKPQQAQPAVRPVVSTKAGPAAKVDLAKEYDYVIADLKKIGTIAVGMFVLLFALAFMLS
ncbi:MAG: hypothetical protein FJ026_07050 [Chloroflexi bacterium]|nr:hypothetical protein [Chloroflexota bacterium]